MKCKSKCNLILVLICLLGCGSCKTQIQIKQIKEQTGEYIGDLRDLIRVGGQRTSDDKLLILNIKNKQAVFEITNSNSKILSNIHHSLVKHLSITRNYDGNYDTKYNTIFILTLKRRAYKSLDHDLKEILK